MAHNHECTNVRVDNNLKKALIASDAASGLIIACALVTPSKKLADLRMESVIKKFHSKDFAKRVDRGRISLCEEIGLRRDEFLAISLEALKIISSELGL
ncbi:MAG: hypothetical protein QW520_00905 [Methanomassiliicoccales archaeon]